MAYNTTDSVPRQDISTLLMEAVHQEKHYIASMLLPIYGSEREVGRYPKFTIGKGELLKRESQKRGATGTYNESDEVFEWDSYQTVEYGHEKRIDDVVRKQMRDFFDAEMVTAKFCMNKLMLDYEVEAAAAMMTPSSNAGVDGKFVATSTPTGTATYAEANLEFMDVPADINAVIEQLTLVGEEPNTMVMSLSLFNRIKRSKKLQTYLYGHLNTTQGGSNITSQIIADAFGIANVIVAKKSHDTAIKGKSSAATVAPVWGNSHIWIGDVQGGDFMNGGAGRTIIWDGDSEGGLFTTDQYRDEARRGDKIRVRSNRTIKLINPNSARLLTTGL
jgi:hypothetical protein